MAAANPWVYKQSEPGLWTVGFYEPNGKWQPESDHDTAASAAARVHYLNGGNSAELLEALKALLDCAPFAYGPRGDAAVHRQAEAAIAKAEGRS